MPTEVLHHRNIQSALQALQRILSSQPSPEPVSLQLNAGQVFTIIQTQSKSSSVYSIECMCHFQATQNKLYIRIWNNLNTYIWIYMNIYEYIWIYMNIYEYIWIYMNIYEYIWIYMNIYEYNIYIYEYYEYASNSVWIPHNASQKGWRSAQLALEKLCLVSAAMLTMCSTITATRMLRQPKFRKITESLSKKGEPRPTSHWCKCKRYAPPYLPTIASDTTVDQLARVTRKVIECVKAHKHGSGGRRYCH